MTNLEYLERYSGKERALKILEYLHLKGCALKICKPRKTKRGDFRTYGNEYAITINQDENRFRFLFTLIHEIGHLKTHIEFGTKVKPHGSEWKRNFAVVFNHFHMQEIFDEDEDIKQAVHRELFSPSACSGVNINLEKGFAKFDSNSGVLLEELPIDNTFVFKGIHYKKVENRRSRVLCINLKNKRKYTINKAAFVQLYD